MNSLFVETYNALEECSFSAREEGGAKAANAAATPGNKTQGAAK
jgi:hypothetical protein